MNIPSWLWPIAIVVGVSVLHYYRTRSLSEEFDRNDRFAPPTDQQLRWDIRHMREDVMLLCHLVTVLVALMAWQLSR